MLLSRLESLNEHVPLALSEYCQYLKGKKTYQKKNFQHLFITL